MSPTDTATATTAGARDHARAQEGTAADTMVYLPASSYDGIPDGVDPDSMVWAEMVAGGGYTHKVLARGTKLRLTDIDGDACAHVVFYNALEPWERLNVADTQKVQWQVYTDAAQLVLSDQARVLASVTADSSRQHDSIFGASSQARNEERYGAGSAESTSPAARPLLTLAAIKHGLAARDIPPTMSFFKGIHIDADGSPAWQGSAPAGSAITFTAEMPVIVLIANTAHPLDPRADYSCGRLEVAAWRDTPTAPDDDLWTHSPEGRRAFANTADYLAARGIA